jgi:hypothetical protein
MALKLSLVRHLFIALSTTIPSPYLRQSFAPLFRYLITNTQTLIPAEDRGRALEQYAMLAAQVAQVGAPSVVRRFFKILDTRMGKRGVESVGDDKASDWVWDARMKGIAWNAFAKAWRVDGRGSWKGAAVLLGVPFE